MNKILNLRTYSDDLATRNTTERIQTVGTCYFPEHSELSLV
jgi:hypothetical protein